jgi:hypothetical protein
MFSFFPASIGRSGTLVLLGLVGLACVATHAAAQNYDYPLETGYVRLAARLQGFVPNGQTIVMGQAEGEVVAGAYLPDTTNSIFSNVNFTIIDGPGTVSEHATDVGWVIYGQGLSLTTGITQVKLFRADLSGTGILESPTETNWLDPSGPKNIGVDVLNNSWVYNTGIQNYSSQILRRMDWMADAYNIVMVDGTPNDPTAPIPELISSTYNGITVGVSSYVCSHGPTVFQETDGVTAGRCKPDIIAPMPVVSSATALISSYAALLLDEVHLRTSLGETSFAQGIKPTVIKSILQTGANKLPGWTNGNSSTTNPELVPLDFEQGAGQVDIDHSELILSTGLQPPGWINTVGWTYAQSVAPGDTLLYYFVLNDTNADRFAATLNWDRQIASTGFPYTVDTASLPNFQLEFYTYSNGGFTLLDASRSAIDNLQHIQMPSISNGLYILRVINTGTLTSDFALSWGCLPATESDIGP